jgi:hypothetical protein
MSIGPHSKTGYDFELMERHIRVQMVSASTRAETSTSYNETTDTLSTILSRSGARKK